MSILFHALPTAQVQTIRLSGRDAYNNPVEIGVSDGDGIPCRHCLQQVPMGKSYLVLAHRPFLTCNPYAETGPVFLCAEACSRATPSADPPAILTAPAYLLRGYGADERIVYGTGRVTPTQKTTTYATMLLARSNIGFVDVRSASNNCFQCRIHPGS